MRWPLTRRRTGKLAVSNKRDAPQKIVVEPWANDYTLLPNEELVIIAFGKNSVPHFEIIEWEGTTQVYCESADDFKVLQGECELECGHNRQPKQLT